MRNGAFRLLAGGVLLLGGGGLAAGCGLAGGDNSKQICTDTKRAYEQFATQVRGLPANQPAPWKQATEQLAGKVDGLSAKAEDTALKKVLKDEAGRLRAAAGPAGTGDVSQLSSVTKDTPQRIGGACS